VPAPDAASAEENALAALERSSVLAALTALPIRQRQVIVLRYYADLSEAQIAATLGIAPGLGQGPRRACPELAPGGAPLAFNRAGMVPVSGGSAPDLALSLFRSGRP
jgi:hypothetical protein